MLVELDLMSYYLEPNDAIALSAKLIEVSLTRTYRPRRSFPYEFGFMCWEYLFVENEEDDRVIEIS